MRIVSVAASALLAFMLAASSQAEDTTQEPVAAKKPFVPPDGWREKKRGQYTVYCRKETQMGTRVQKETCYDEEGIRAMLVAQQDDREKVDQMRRICSSQATCGAR